MRTHVLGLVLYLGLAACSGAAEPRTMRLDYYHTGNASQELFALDRVVLEPLAWPGNPHRPGDGLNLGRYSFEVRDRASGQLHYGRGFDSIYGEWVTTAEARAKNRTFHESLRFPAPEAPVQITLRKRAANNAWREAWSAAIDPKDPYVDSSVPDPLPLLELQKHGDPATKVDLLLLGDGYTAAQQQKFEADARRMMECLFAASPFKERRRDFNVWGLCPPARQAGISRPSDGLHRASPLGTTYDAFGSERYVLTFDNQALRRLASSAPYDFVVILANSPTYGGGGIFGLYSTVAVDSAWAPYIFVHELGHHLAGLADEYYTSPVAYLPSEKRIEPWEPNVTALLDPARLKWKDLAAENTPLPTGWQKEAYEGLSKDFQQRRAQIRQARQPESEFDALLRENKLLEDRLLGAEKFTGKVGAFEGANYQAKGCYRPEVNCIMFTRTDYFCAVCRRAIERVIDHYATKP